MTRIRSRSSDLPAGTTFPPLADGFALGGDYSPEQWPEEVWVEDVELMRRAGVNSVNLGVFSWGLIEVADGEFDFGWLDRIMDLLHEGGIGVNLATPTAAPPIWLMRAHPEIACVTDTGVRLAQGGRLAWSPASKVFRRYALRVVERMAERYGEHPALRMWHISNELGNENAHDFGDETAAAFQDWLRERFATIEDLVEAWGTASGATATRRSTRCCRPGSPARATTRACSSRSSSTRRTRCSATTSPSGRCSAGSRRASR
jgi:beta-galactosidase